MSWLDQSAIRSSIGAEGGATLCFFGPPIHFLGGSHCFYPLNERPIWLYDADDHHHRDADHGGKGKNPAQADCPVRVCVDLVVGQWLVLGQRKDKAPHTKNWCDHNPAPLHPGTRSVSNHILNGIINIISAINPGYSNTFKECNPQKAYTTSCIVVKELKNIHATLSHHS